MKVFRIFLILAFVAGARLQAEEPVLDQALMDQIKAADNCVTLAYDIKLKHFDSDKVFQECVERRAMLIGMQKKYGIGNYGDIDVIDKLEGYNLLIRSDNKLVKREASRFATASGGF